MWISKKEWDTLNLKVHELERNVTRIRETEAHPDVPEWAEKLIDEYMTNRETNNHQ